MSTRRSCFQFHFSDSSMFYPFLVQFREWKTFNSIFRIPGVRYGAAQARQRHPRAFNSIFRILAVAQRFAELTSLALGFQFHFSDSDAPSHGSVDNCSGGNTFNSIFRILIEILLSVQREYISFQFHFSDSRYS